MGQPRHCPRDDDEDKLRRIELPTRPLCSTAPAAQELHGIEGPADQPAACLQLQRRAGYAPRSGLPFQAISRAHSGKEESPDFKP